MQSTRYSCYILAKFEFSQQIFEKYSSSSYVCHGVGHLLTRSGLTYVEVSSEVCHDSFCQLGNSVLLSWVVCHEAFCLHVVSSSSCIQVVCLEPVLFIIPLQYVNLYLYLKNTQMSNLTEILQGEPRFFVRMGRRK